MTGKKTSGFPGRNEGERGERKTRERKRSSFFFFFCLFSLSLLDEKKKKLKSVSNPKFDKPTLESGRELWRLPFSQEASEHMRGAVAPRGPSLVAGKRANAGFFSSSLASSATAAQRRPSTTLSFVVAAAASTSTLSPPPPAPKRPLLLPSLPLLSPRTALQKPRNFDSVVALAGPAGGGVGSKAGGASGEEVNSTSRLLLVAVGIAYISLILLLPAANVFYQAFRNGFGPFIENVLDPDFLHAVKMTFLMAICAVPVNTVWGVAAALLIARNEFRWKPALLAILDLPFSISPVVAGMMLVLLYGRQGLFAPALKVKDSLSSFS